MADPATGPGTQKHSTQVKEGAPVTVENSALLRAVKDNVGGRTEVEHHQIAVLLEQVLTTAPRETIEGSLEDLILTAIDDVDVTVSRQLNHIMHAKAFQDLEATWRGVENLLLRTQTSSMLKVYLFNVTKDELARDLIGKKSLSSEFFNKFHESGYGVLGGVPYGAIFGDYEFSHSARDIKLLTGIAEVAAVAHAPFVAAASPAMFELHSNEPSKPGVAARSNFSGIAIAGDLSETLENKDHASWNTFRTHPDSRSVALLLTRVLMRSP